MRSPVKISSSSRHHEKATTTANVEPPQRPDLRMITDVHYMRLYGMCLREPRRMVECRPSLDTTWYHWKSEEYMHGATSIKGSQEASNSGRASEATNRFLTSLDRLPPELLTLILSILPVLAQLCARLSCPTFYYCGGSQSLFSLICSLRFHHD